MPARLDPELHSTGDHPHQTVPKRVARSAEIPSIGNSLPVVRARWPLTLFAESICCEALMAARGETSTGRDSQCHMYKRLRRTTIRKPVLQMAAKSTPHIQQPSFAEFGVEWAESADDFAPALSSHLNPVTVHLYDNFEKGLPKAGAKDHNMAQGRAGKFAGTMDNARKRWSNFGYTPVLHKGLFTSSLFAQPPPRNLIGVHSDGDLYVSIYEVLVMTYNHVVPGGAFIIDDWSGGQGIWESARKAVYDFAIHEEVAPNLRTPVAGASAFWQKSQSDACPGCYPDIQFKPFNLGAISATDMARHKDRLMSLTEEISSAARCAPSSGVPQASDDTVFGTVVRWQTRQVAGAAVHTCRGASEDVPATGDTISSVTIHASCADGEYDEELMRWWRVLPIGGMVVLPCWDDATASAPHGCRPGFYRFVAQAGIMPHLQTVYGHPTAFWIKGPSPLG
eukprot:jgi/Tetstr1/464733/TSEL_009480.t1